MSRNKNLDSNGHEVLSDRPVAIPSGMGHPLSLEARITRAVRSEQLRMYAEQQGEETFEEADDFDVGDDFDPHSPYEQHFDHDANIEALERRIKAPKRPPKPLPEEEPKPKAAKKKAAPKPSEDDSEES